MYYVFIYVCVFVCMCLCVCVKKATTNHVKIKK